MNNEIPRRNQPVEDIIHEAIENVERMPYDLRLERAKLRLQEVKDLVGEFIDERLTFRPDKSDRDWIEDLLHENGNYSCRCFKCGLQFNGHKRRVQCKLCAQAIAEPNVINVDHQDFLIKTDGIHVVPELDREQDPDWIQRGLSEE